jgi:transcriptional regulator with XRE-family HTH domain
LFLKIFQFTGFLTRGKNFYQPFFLAAGKKTGGCMVTDSYKTIFGKRLKTIRLKRGLTQMELNSMCGYTSSATLSLIERGLKSMHHEKIELAAKALQVPSFILTQGEEADYTSEELDLILLLCDSLRGSQYDPGLLPTLKSLLTALEKSSPS